MPSKYTRKIPLVLYIYKTSYELLVSPFLAAYNIFDDSLYEENTLSVKANNVWFTAWGSIVHWSLLPQMTHLVTSHVSSYRLWHMWPLKKQHPTRSSDREKVDYMGVNWEFIVLQMEHQNACHLNRRGKKWYSQKDVFFYDKHMLNRLWWLTLPDNNIVGENTLTVFGPTPLNRESSALIWSDVILRTYSRQIEPRSSNNVFKILAIRAALIWANPPHRIASSTAFRSAFWTWFACNRSLRHNSIHVCDQGCLSPESLVINHRRYYSLNIKQCMES